MKRRTVDGVALHPHWLGGYVGEVPLHGVVHGYEMPVSSRRVYFRQRGSKWTAHDGLPLWSRTVATAPTLKQVVAMVKQA